jgi:hypothetical protein
LQQASDPPLDRQKIVCVMSETAGKIIAVVLNNLSQHGLAEKHLSAARLLRVLPGRRQRASLANTA